MGNADFTTMDDPDFPAERKRVRETIEALQERYRQINEEFDRRARAKWTNEQQQASLAKTWPEGSTGESHAVCISTREVGSVTPTKSCLGSQT
jgi:hypothetical protein